MTAFTGGINHTSFHDLIRGGYYIVDGTAPDEPPAHADITLPPGKSGLRFVGVEDQPDGTGTITTISAGEYLGTNVQFNISWHDKNGKRRGSANVNVGPSYTNTEVLAQQMVLEVGTTTWVNHFIWVGFRITTENFYEWRKFKETKTVLTADGRRPEVAFTGGIPFDGSGGGGTPSPLKVKRGGAWSPL